LLGAPRSSPRCGLAIGRSDCGGAIPAACVGRLRRVGSL
jgi:hypothetical protein